jgi:hypothetical protein
VAVAAVLAACVHVRGSAQQPPAYPTPDPAAAYPATPTPPTSAYPPTTSYPATTGYPTTSYPAVTYPQPYPGVNSGFTSAPPPSGRFRDIFAGTLALVLQQTGTQVSASIAQGVSGSIANWFARKSMPASAAYPGYAPGYQTQAYPSTGAVTGYSGAPTGYPGAPTGYPGSDPSTGAGAYPGTNGYQVTPSDPTATGATPYPSTATATYPPASGYPSATGNPTSTVYAGMAFEVHLLTADGRDTAVDPTTYLFNTGDRFLVYYRPSLPGTVQIFNTNPLGQTSRIDTVNIAAGQLATLGPYQFTDNKGDETLQLLLSPCSDSNLLAATRDIVKVGGTAGATAGVNGGPANGGLANYGLASGGLALPACSAAATRGVKPKTREIRKVGVDGGTSYALDAVSQQELSSGQYDSRAVKIGFHHR